ncbi:MAG TPA: 3'-5' exoribonuclease [Terriglobales bacterium]|nr:3'-5' exoribonuclease [Terriglobales bacterium]
MALVPVSVSLPAGARRARAAGDVYFSADIETDGPIPGPFSMLSFALVYAGSFDGTRFCRPEQGHRAHFYRELRPISDEFQEEALRVNGLDRERLKTDGCPPAAAMGDAAAWVRQAAGDGQPVLVAYPLSFDWAWLYWYFIRFTASSPFSYSRCFDLKTAYAVKAGVPIAEAGRSKLLASLRPNAKHSHHALDDATEQAEIFANVFEWGGGRG